jgi:hypothetical protein
LAVLAIVRLRGAMISWRANTASSRVTWALRGRSASARIAVEVLPSLARVGSGYSVM